MTDQPTLFDSGEIDAREAKIVPEFHVEYVAGILAQFAWGDGRRTKAQREQSIVVARDALGRLSG